MNLIGLSKEVAEKYRETLSTLTFNNKIVINTLTEIAKEEVKHAAVVTKVIEDRIRKVKADQMLPLMYLMDSICKNIGVPYNELFQQNLVSNFSLVFQAVNEKSMTNSKIKASQVRAMLYKLRLTWGDKYHVFTDQKLHQLDAKIKTIDPAWPVSASAPKERSNNQTPKILVNPAFVGKAETAEDETERMRAELLQKEKELLALKRQEIDQQIATYKRHMDQTISPEDTKPSSTTSHSVTSSQSKVSKKDPKSEKESRDPRSRDPRRKRAADDKDPRSEKRSGTSSPRDLESSSRTKKDRSPTSKSSQKSDTKKSSSSKSSSSSKLSSKSSSKSSKGEKDSGKLEKTDSRKRARENDKSPSPTKEGRISPLPPPTQNLGRIPKVKRTGGKSGKDESPDQESRRPNKRSGNSGKVSPIPEKKSKSLFIETDVNHDAPRDAPSPQVGWGVYKEEHPDQFRTPVKEENNFNWSEAEMDHYRGRSSKDRGGRFPRRNPDWDNRGGRGGRGGRGVWNPDNKWKNGRAGAGTVPNGSIPPFMANSGPPVQNFPFMGTGGLPDWNSTSPEMIRKEFMPMLVNTTSPEIIRKEVIPMLVQLGEEGKRTGKLNEGEFRNLMEQVALLNETSLTKEQELRMMKSQEDKENRRQGDRNWRPDQGPARPHLLPPPLIDGEASSLSQGRSPHKNDLPMADPQLLELIDGDPTRSLNIDDVARTIRFYGETATIVMSDDRVCELSFQPDPEDRKIVINGTIIVFTRVNQGYKEVEIDGEKHEIKIGPPTRELWVDGKWYECYFQHSVGVRIGAGMQEVFLDGDPPIVKIGEPRPDLCLGRVYAILDNDISKRMPIYLDRKPQLLQISGKDHIIQFVEDFKTLTINGHPFKPEFGGFPMVISVLGKKHFVRLTSLPPGINLKNLRAAPYGLNPPSLPNPMRGPSPVNPDGRERSPRTPEAGPVSPYSPPKDESSQDGIGLGKDDPLNSLISLFPANNESLPATAGSNYNTEPGPDSGLPPPPPAPLPPPVQSPTVEPKDVNVNKLFASLLEFGLITNKSGPGFSGGIPGISPVVEEKPKVSLPEPPPELIPPQATTKTPKLKVANAPVKHIVLKSHHPSLKERQESVLEQLYRAEDLQCKSCGVRFSKDEMPLYTSHLDWHFRMKRREKDNAKRAQSRKWYFEKNDWIESDEIEDEATDEKLEEEEKEEEEIVIKTVPVGDGQKNTCCPVCREDFDQFYKQSGDGVEEEGWYLHNAMIHEGVIYHPECFKDLQKNGELDNSLDTTADSVMDTSSGVIKEEAPEESDQEMKPVVPDVKLEQTEEMITEPAAAEPSEKVVETPLSLKEEQPEPELEAANTEPMDLTAEDKTELSEQTEVKQEEPEPEVKEEAEKEVEKEVEEESSANTSLVGDEESHMLAAPVMSQPKVEFKLNINKPIRSVERLESVASQSDTEESEFDSDAIITPKIDVEVLDSQKPRLKGKKLTEWPARQQDKDLSGLCSIM